jgi:hypothetical protein
MINPNFSQMVHYTAKGVANNGGTIICNVFWDLFKTQWIYMTGILIANKILGYFRFVDDVLIIYNYTIT